MAEESLNSKKQFFSCILVGSSLLHFLLFNLIVLGKGYENVLFIN